MEPWWQLEVFCVTASELSQLARSWGVVHIVSTLAIIENVIYNNDFKLKGKIEAIFL